MRVRHLCISPALLFFGVAVVSLHRPVVSSQEQALAEPELPTGCYNYTQSCDMGTEDQLGDSSAVILACSREPATRFTWYRRNYNNTGIYSGFSLYQFDLTEEPSGFDGENWGVVAVSLCTFNPDSNISTSEATVFDRAAVMTTAKVHQEPGGSIVLSYWYRHSLGAPNITSPYGEIFLYVYIDYYDTLDNMLDVRVLREFWSAVVNNSLHLNFNDILDTAGFFQAFSHEGTPADLPEGAQKDAVDTLLQITGQIFSAEETGKLEAPATSSDGYDAAATIYEALENMYNSLPPNEEPYVFSNSLSVAYVSAVLINGSSQFEDFNLTTKMETRGFSRETGITAAADDSTASVASISFKTSALQEAFEELKQTANTTPVKFAFSLSAMPSFKFARFVPTNELNERSSPIVLLASLGVSLKKKDIITIRHNVDSLFDHPSGARRQHQCIFLNYTSKHWSGDGCRMTAKHVQWDNSTVECTCDHLTPFSLLLTLCGSLSRSFIPKDQPLTLDLAVVTTATTLVAMVCCGLALIIIMVKIWHGLVVFDDVNFVRMGLWIALFGMYLFTIFSQLMVYAPKLCGQQFCLANGILVHWFTLMSVGWTVVQTVDILRILLFPFKRDVKRQSTRDKKHVGFRIKTWVAATFIPGLFPFLASVPYFFDHQTAIHSLGGYGYGDHEKWCWLNAEQTWIPWVTFIIPLSAAGMVNVAVVILYVREEIKKKKRGKQFSIPEDSSRNAGDRVKHRVRQVMINTGLMGLIWLYVWLALFSCFSTLPKLQYVFVLLLTVACGSQAVYVIIFQGILGDKSSKSTNSSTSSSQTYVTARV
ncbi:adhesion G protein-coupled receptor L2-like isoform X2 [Paramacrobiotus metropolitanus]|uniref:adhesion G protein-coupled receptor L2-like isoform X2 n=1 Tax=Paramacrobiotus metropolitanus TaxID=2943436 RepID=UPI0024459951|nr:adhesion G protein-coupled receptor L2-like isoform X2 [Paramacrobiotus metropolitanus]